MSKSSRFASALSAITLATVLAGCATSQMGAGATTVAGKSAKGDAALGTRALIALNAGDFAAAIQLAERAVEQTPEDVTLRTVLANAYFGAGRFASAESAYRDVLTLNSNQPDLVLRLALVQIAQGKNAEALSLLGAAQQMLDRADLGLALALAGQPLDAISVLEPAARMHGADSRLRQNLAFAHALAGDWTTARVVAAQDLAPDVLDQRIQQWMSLAKPARASDQVAALTGVAPAPADPGQPVQLALNPPQTRTAAAAPVAVPQPPQSDAPQSGAPLASAPAAAVALAEPVAQYVPPQAWAAPLAEQPQAPVQAETAPQLVEALIAAPVAPAVEPLPTRFEQPQPVAAKLDLRRPPVRANGNSSSVVQLGAYGSPKRVEIAWEDLSRRFPSLNRYRPVSARFNSAKGVVYRLAVKGFASNGDAQDMCESLQAKGKNCFVRRVAGDSPVSFAGR
jgi:Flp pilus assembly protein TadD